MKSTTLAGEILKQEGTECLFCFPVNPLIDAAAEAGIRPIMPCTERTVIGMADGYTRVNNGRRIGVCAVQMGPGIENTFGGIAQAFSDSTPILCLPGGPPQNRSSVPPNFDPVLNYRHVIKWVDRINKADRIPEFFRRAFTYLRTGRPGPVMLEFPMDVAGVQVDDSVFSYKPVKGGKAMADPESVAASVKAIVAAQKPLLHAGSGVLYAEAWEELREFAELLQIPVMTTLPGKSCFPENHPLSLGCGGLTGPRPVARYLLECDSILGVGSSFSISSFAAPLPRGKKAVQLTVDERDLNKDYAVDLLMMGDAKLTLRRMIEEARRLLGPEGRRGDDRAVKAIKAMKDEWMDEWMPKLTSEEVPINPYRVIWDLQQAVNPENTIVTHDAGNPRDMTAPFWKALVPNSYIGWGKSTHLGYSIPLALGAKVAKPEKTVINIMGDGAFGMSGMEIATAARNRIGILTVILNNSCLGGYDKHIPVASRLYRTRFISGDYRKVAEGLGAYAERVEQPGDIIPAVHRALTVTAEGRPALLEFITKEELQLSRYW
ncbi:MAG: thiamine pyrophosphate-requiring protein [Syntrophaceae bacterium]|nr:thiamine pyrophosphate-requiring protein [Syntrophaceae bacterium]